MKSNNTLRNKIFLLLAAVSVISVAAVATFGQGGRANDASRRSTKAALIIKSIMQKPDSAIPSNLLERAEAVVVCPEVSQAAFGIGGRTGQCVVSRRTNKGWSTPAFYNISGGSFGLQIGATKSDHIFLVMNKDGVNGLLEDKFEMGGEGGAVACPIGRNASAETNATLDAGILSYAKSKGAYIGAALKGSALTPDNDLNKAFYGKDAKEVLDENNAIITSKMPKSVRIFPTTLARFSSRKL